MCAFIPSTVRQLLRSQTDRQHLISQARLKLKQSSLWGRAKKKPKEIRFKLNFAQKIYMIDIVQSKIHHIRFLVYQTLKDKGSLRYNTKGGFPRNMVCMSSKPRRVKLIHSDFFTTCFDL